MEELNLGPVAPKVQKCPQNGGPKLDFLTFFEVAPNGSGIAQVCSRDPFESIFELCSVKFSPPTVDTASRTLRKCATPGVPEIMVSQLFRSCPESFRDDSGMIRGFVCGVFELGRSPQLLKN